MKIIKCNKSRYRASVNFVDENDVLVGFEVGQDCCEEYGVFLTDSLEKAMAERTEETPVIGEEEFMDKRFPFPDPDLVDAFEGLRFDREFLREVEMRHEPGYYEPEYRAIFKLVSPSGADHYLVLFNLHNGYYAHDFKFQSGDDVIQEGSL